MVAFLERAGLEDATVLEIGGGVGEIHLELLKRGAARAVNLELSPAYDAEAARLVREAAVDPRASSGACTTSPRRRARSSPRTSSCCIASCAATPTTSACSAPRRRAHAGCSSSAIRAGTRFPAR